MKKLFGLLLILPSLILAQVWTARYNGPGNNRDEAYSIIIDSTYNVYIAGNSVNSGNIDWPNYDYCTVKYNSAGIEQWVARYNGTSDTIDQTRGIGIDESLNVYVTGRSYNWATKSDIVTIKYNQLGQEQWIRTHNGPSNDEDHPYAMAVSPNGDVYVGGYQTGIGTYWDYFLIKYNSQGESLWVATCNGPDNSNDVIWALKIDQIGNCYVTGYSGGIGTSLDILTIKYNPAGETVWTARYDGTGHDYDRGWALAVNDSGEVWVAGLSLDSVNQQDCVTIKYDANGVQQWVARYNGPANNYDRAYGIVLDAEDNAYVIGSSVGNTNFADIITIKYNTDGDEQWLARYDGPAYNIDIGEAIALDPFGNVCVTGHSQNITTSIDYVTIKYNPLGETLWTTTYDAANLDDEAFKLLTDDLGYIYVTGYSMGGNSDRDFFTIKYYPSGLTNIDQDNFKNIAVGKPEIFPNPARSAVQVSILEPVQLFNISGQIVATLKHGINKINRIPKGIYFAKISDKKIVKLIILEPNP